MDAFPNNFNKKSCSKLYALEQEQIQKDFLLKFRKDIFDTISNDIKNPLSGLNNPNGKISFTFPIGMSANSSSTICLELLENFGSITIDIGENYGRDAYKVNIIAADADSFKQHATEFTSFYKIPMNVHKVVFCYR